MLTDSSSKVMHTCPQKSNQSSICTQWLLGEDEVDEVVCVKPEEVQISARSLFVVWIVLPDPFQHVDLQLGCFSVLFQILDDL